MNQVLIGHRGFPNKYPENTIASFLGALCFGADGVELDVWLTRDKKVVVIHDPDTERMTGQKLVIKESFFSELRELDLGMGQRIPLLEEVIDALPLSALLFVEIKDVEASIPAYNIIKEKGRLNTTVFISFKPEALQKIRDVSQEARLGFIIGDPNAVKGVPELINKLKLYAIAPPIYGVRYLGKEKFVDYLRMIKEGGLSTAVWVINTVDEYRLVKDYADTIITDNVLRLKHLLK